MAAPLYVPPIERARTIDADMAELAARAPAARRRSRLAELDSHIHCSILGTCLSMGDLRRLVPRYTDYERDHASDLELHHAAVQLAVDGGEAAKALHKTLDERHDAAIKRFNKARGTGDVRALWKAALKDGDVPGAYWAVMTAVRREEAERRAREAAQAQMLAELQLERAREESQALRIELAAMEEVLARDTPSDASRPAGPSPWQDKRVVYVGGRPSALRTIRTLADRAGVGLTVHDGGIEDRKGLLSAALASADAVVFPVDCVDHDSMSQVKRVCERHGVTWHALRSSSVAAFAAWMAPARGDAAPPASRFCLRHG